MTIGRQPAPRLEPLSAPVPSEGMGCGPPNHKVWLVTKQPLRFGPIRTKRKTATAYPHRSRRCGRAGSAACSSSTPPAPSATACPPPAHLAVPRRRPGGERPTTYRFHETLALTREGGASARQPAMTTSSSSPVAGIRRAIDAQFTSTASGPSPSWQCAAADDCGDATTPHSSSAGRVGPTPRSAWPEAGRGARVRTPPR